MICSAVVCFFLIMLKGFCFILKPKERKKRELSNCRSKTIQLWTKIDQKLERIRGGGVKEQLDLFLSTVPDKSKICEAMPLNSEKSNSVIHQVERGKKCWSRWLSSRVQSGPWWHVACFDCPCMSPKRTMHATFKLCFSSVNKVQTCVMSHELF